MLILDSMQLICSERIHIRRAAREFQLGQFQRAYDTIQAESENYYGDEARLLAQHCQARIVDAKYIPSLHDLVWQVETSVWEADWIRLLFGSSCRLEIVDTKHTHVSKHMLVVDNRLDKRKAEYYRSCCEQGSYMTLIHLSDESYTDDLSCYRSFKSVYRNYYSLLLEESQSIKAFPLGYKSGFASAQPVLSSFERPFTWSFAGDPKKASRQSMLGAFASVSKGKVHLTSGFNATDTLNTQEYRSLLDSTVFAPCPAGNVNLETFRIWEALEAGAIPIIQAVDHFDYLSLLVGKYPFPRVSDWAEAANNIASMSEAAIRDLQLRCLNWWRCYKTSLISEISDAITHTGGNRPMSC